MKVLQFMPEFRLAGAETMCENLTYELMALGHQVTVASLYDYHSPITERLENKGVDLRYLGKKPGLDLSIIKRIRNIIKEINPDIIHTHLYILKYVYAASIGLHARAIVHTVHNVAQKENNKLNRFINKLIFRFGKATPVALSNLIAETINQVYGLNIDSIPVIFNGVQLSKCIPISDYKFSEHINLIHVGRYMPVKNHKSLISAVVKLHDSFPLLQLHLFGDGELKSEIRSQISDMDANSYIFDHGLTDNIYSQLSRSDIFILPSTYEGIPMTIIEAMATGLPVIASRVGGIPDMIDDGINGLLCGTDPDSVKNSLLKLLEDESLRKSIGEKAKLRANDFTAEKMAKDYVNTYNTLIIK